MYKLGDTQLDGCECPISARGSAIERLRLQICSRAPSEDPREPLDDYQLSIIDIFE